MPSVKLTYGKYEIRRLRCTDKIVRALTESLGAANVDDVFLITGNSIRVYHDHDTYECICIIDGMIRRILKYDPTELLDYVAMLYGRFN